MTIGEVIARVDDLKKNGYRMEEKIQWLSDIEWILKREVFDTHTLESDRAKEYTGYTAKTPLDTVLLCDPPYDLIYVRYLEMMMYYYEGENVRYENAKLMFESVETSFKEFYNREHPASTVRKLVFF